MLAPSAVKAFLEKDLDDFDWLKNEGRKHLNEALSDLEVRPHFHTRPYLHQKVCFLLGVYNPYFLYLLDMGLGKTKITLDVLAYYKLLGESTSNLVLVPNRINMYTWEDEAAIHQPDLKFLTLDEGSKAAWEMIEEPFDLAVTTYASLTRMIGSMARGKKGKQTLKLDPKKKLLMQRLLSGVVYDECFIAGTKVSTINGEKNIEDVCVNDIVLSSNGPQKVNVLFKGCTNTTVVVELESGAKIECTPNHPFFTEKGWMPAHMLEGFHVYENKDLRNLPERVPSPSDERFYQKTFLFDELCSNLENVSTGNNEKNTQKEYVRKNIKNTKRETPSKHSLEQGETFIKRAQKQFVKIFKKYWSWPNRENSWGQRETFSKSSSKAFRFTPKWVDSRICNSIRKKTKGLSKLLQSGYSQPKENDNFGSGRKFPRGSFVEKNREQSGQKKRQEVIGSGVVSVSVRKHSNPIPVYNLEVNKSPHYFAAGILVHNSTALKNHDTITFRACRALSKATNNRYALTGTPFGRDPTDLWAQFYAVDGGETLGPTLGLFREGFCTASNNFWSGGQDWKFDKKKKKLLYQRIRNRSIYYESEECIDLPKKVFKKVAIPFSREGWGYYQKVLAGARMAKGNYKQLDNAFYNMRTITSGFVGMKTEDGEERMEVKFKENPKIEAMLQLISEMPQGRKMLVFHEFIPTGDVIEEALKKAGVKCIRLSAKTKNEKMLERQFRDDKSIVVFIVSNKKGSKGLNLQSANYVVFFESPVSPIERAQAEKRAHRMGQYRTTYYYDLCMKGSVDMRIRGFLREGKDLFNAIVKGKAWFFD